MATELAEATGETKARRRRRRDRATTAAIVAAREIHGSGMVAGLTHPGQLLALFLTYQAKGRPLGQVLLDYDFAGGRPVRRSPRVAPAQPAPAPAALPAPAPSAPGAERPAGGRQSASIEARREATERFGNREVQPLPLDWPKADGLDRRLWTEILEEEVGRVQATIAGLTLENGLAPIEATTAFRAINHMATAAITAGTPEGPFLKEGTDARKPPGECNGQLMIIYRRPAWRDWMRLTLAAYLRAKEKAAKAEVDLQVYGDIPADPENENQEPPHRPEEESQLALAGPAEDDGRGDAYEPPNH